MSIYNEYQRRLNSQGEGLSDSILNSTSEIFNESFSNAPTFFNCLVNDNLTVGMRVLNDSTDPSKRSILFKENDIQHGDYVDFQSDKWLVVNRPYFNKIYSKSEMALCNEEITIVVGESEPEIIEEDSLGRPVYGDTVLETDTIPIVVESKTDQAFDRDEQINLPEGRLIGQIQYDPSLPISLETKFEIFNATYRVYNIDLSQVYKDKGVMRLFIEKSN